MAIKVVRLLAVTFLSLTLSACGLSGGPVEGRVLEVDTDKPIAGAIVVVRWQGYVSIFPADTRDVCVHVETATTDKEGYFYLPKWRKEAHIKGVRDLRPLVTIYRSEYEEVNRGQGIIYLKPSLDSGEERLKVIRTSGVKCGSAGESKKNLIPFYRSLIEEANSLGASNETKLIINNLLYKIDLIKLPYIEAEKRNIERSEALRREYQEGYYGAE